MEDEEVVQLPVPASVQTAATRLEGTTAEDLQRKSTAVTAGNDFQFWLESSSSRLLPNYPYILPPSSFCSNNNTKSHKAKRLHQDACGCYSLIIVSLQHTPVTQLAHAHDKRHAILRLLHRAWLREHGPTGRSRGFHRHQDRPASDHRPATDDAA